MNAELVVQAQRGDRTAFGELAVMLGDRLYALAFRILRDADMAQDAAQEAIVTIWRDLRALREPERFEAWAYRVLVRTCYREARRRRAGEAKLHLVHDRTSVEDHASAVVNRDELERVFGNLSADQRAVIALHYYLGMTHPEVAEVLDVPVGTVASRLHAAKRALRAGLAADARRTRAGGLSA